MLTNHTTITLFCSKKNGRETLWVRHILEDVNFHGADQLIVGDKEVRHGEEYVIRVPSYALTNYVDQLTWKALSADEAENCFTLKKGDYIVKGKIAVDVSSAGEILKNYEALEILSVTENLRASPYSKHIKLVIK